MLSLYRLLFRPAVQPTLEQRFLLSVLRIDSDEVARQEVVDLVRQGIDWARVLHDMDQHRVESLLYWQLQACLGEFIPADVLAKLKHAYETQRWSNLHLSGQMAKIVRDMAAHGIDVLPLKGAAFALMLYDNPFLREYKDIDLLVHHKAQQAAQDILLANGYRLAEWLAEDPTKIQDEFLEPQHLTFVRVEASHLAVTQVELHWSVSMSFSSFEAHAEGLWSRVLPVQVGGFRFSGLPSDELLIILVMHGAKHMWASLHWLYDLVMFDRRYPDFDWEGLLHTAEQRGIKRLMLVSLMTAHRLIGLPLSPAVRAAVEQDAIVPILAGYNIDMFYDANRFDTPNGQFRFVAFQLLVRQSLRERLHYLIYTLRHRRSRTTRILLIELLVGTIVIIAALFFLLDVLT